MVNGRDLEEVRSSIGLNEAPPVDPELFPSACFKQRRSCLSRRDAFLCSSRAHNEKQSSHSCTKCGQLRSLQPTSKTPRATHQQLSNHLSPLQQLLCDHSPTPKLSNSSTTASKVSLPTPQLLVQLSLRFPNTFTSAAPLLQHHPPPQKI